MFIAGTRDVKQMLLNGLDLITYGGDKALSAVGNTILHSAATELGFDHSEQLIGNPIHVKLLQYLDIPRHRKSKTLARIARDNGVTVVYGHSRGGALADDMDLPMNVQKIGLDAAKIISNDTEGVNIYEGGGLNPLGWFDEIIGLTGKNNIHYDGSPLSPHKAWAT